MINGVLTERTVKDVVPILQTNSDGLKQALEELVKQYKLKQDEMEKWKARHRSTKTPSQYHTTNSPHRRRTTYKLSSSQGSRWVPTMQQPFDRMGTRYMPGAT
jgi:hypothetical protein